MCSIPLIPSPGGESGELVNVPVEERVRLRVGDVELLAGLGDVPGDALRHGNADLVVAALKQIIESRH